MRGLQRSQRKTFKPLRGNENFSSIHNDLKVFNWILIQFNSIRFNPIQFYSFQFNLIQFNSIQFNSIQFNSIRFNSFEFYSIQFNKKEGRKEGRKEVEVRRLGVADGVRRKEGS